MVTVEFHFIGNKGDEVVEQMEIDDFSFEAVEELINTHWDNIIVQKWRIVDDNLMEESDNIIKVEVIGEDVGDGINYFERPFEERFQHHMEMFDNDYSFDKYDNDIKGSSEVYIMCTDDKRYCVLTTNDVIVSQDFIITSPRAMETLRGIFGDFKDSTFIEDKGVKTITEPKKIALIIREISDLESQQDTNEELKNELRKLKWDLKLALFKDYHDEMIDALITPIVDEKETNKFTFKSLPRRVMNFFINIKSAMIEGRLFSEIVGALWETFKQLMWWTIVSSFFNFYSYSILIAFYNEKLINLLDRLKNEFGMKWLWPVVAPMKYIRNLWDEGYKYTISNIISFGIGYKVNEEDWDGMNILQKLNFTIIRIVKDILLFTVTVLPPFYTEYELQLRRLQTNAVN